MVEEDVGPLEPTTGEKAGKTAAIALNAIPVAGGALAAIAGEVIEGRQNRRLRRFLRDLTTDLQSLEERLNKEFMATAEFEDLAEDVISRAGDTRQQEKLDAFRAIFVNTTLSESPSYNEAAEIAQLVDGWQPRHILLLKILDDPRGADDERGVVVGEPSRSGFSSTSLGNILSKLLPDWDQNQIRRTWGELHDARIHNTSGTATMMTNTGIRQLEGRLTDWGKKVAAYLRNSATDS